MRAAILRAPCLAWWAWASAACAAGAPAGSPANDSPIARLHAEKCGACHAPPRPQTRSRPYLEDALGRHRRRVHLNAEQWQAMIDFLAAPVSHERHPAP